MGAEAGLPTVHNEYTYDAKRGNLVEIRHNTDGNAANDVVYSFEQDALGRQTAVKVGNQTLSQSAYQNDPTKPNFGTLTATTYGNGAKISSRYDDFNRVTGVVYGEETAPRYEYDYNAQGKVARVRDNLLNRTTQSEYDLANRPVRVKTAEAGQHVYTGQVAYDNVYGNLSEFTEKVGENRQEFGTKFGYDDENRPTSLTYSMGAATIGQSTTTIDKLNRTTFSAVKLGSKTFTSEYHFAAGGYGTGSVTNLVASITQPGCNCGYGYDDNGNIASATLNGKWTGYTYDALGQLIQVNDHSDTRSGENGTTWKYTYDLGGNILKKERFAYADTTTPLETVTYEYGDANWRDKLTAVNGSTIRYDAIGNPLSDGTWTYTWQNGRQLQKMQKSGVTAEFVYNADGLRVQKTVNGVATKYTLHGKNVVHMTSGTDELHFFYDAQNRPAVVVYNGTAYAYVKSLQGDVIALLDGMGNVVVSYMYDAWGMPIGKNGALSETLGTMQPFRYRGYAYDEETGLYYLRSRYYRAEWCRFLNADVLIEGNLYDYCLNNPIMQNDLMGLESEHATPAPNPPPISSATPTPIAPLIYKVPLFSQGGWSLCWAYCAVMTYCYKNNVTDMTQEEADLMAISFACEYQLDKLQIDVMTTGTSWWNQGGWPADIGTECLARDIESIYSIRELLESGPVYGYYNGEIENNGARTPTAHLIVVTGVDVNNDIIYTNNPWGYSGKQTFEEFMHGFYMSPYENIPLCSIFRTK